MKNFQVILSPVMDPLTRKGIQPVLDHVGEMSIGKLHELCEEDLGCPLEVWLNLNTSRRMYGGIVCQDEFTPDEHMLVLGMVKDDFTPVRWPKLRKKLKIRFNSEFDIRVNLRIGQEAVYLMRKNTDAVTRDLRLVRHPEHAAA